eukprot:7373111-Pyramimonas_sp.AAC.1
MRDGRRSGWPRRGGFFLGQGPTVMGPCNSSAAGPCPGPQSRGIGAHALPRGSGGPQARCAGHLQSC